MPFNLTPGLIDDEARHAFTAGGCGVLALALHDRTGWPIIAIDDLWHYRNGRMAARYAFGRTGNTPVTLGAVHYAVLHPSGLLLDIEGLHEPRHLVATYTHRAGRPLMWGRVDRADVADVDWLTWLVDHDTAARYVDPVLSLLP